MLSRDFQFKTYRSALGFSLPSARALPLLTKSGLWAESRADVQPGIYPPIADLKTGRVFASKGARKPHILSCNHDSTDFSMRGFRRQGKLG